MENKKQTPPSQIELVLIHPTTTITAIEPARHTPKQAQLRRMHTAVLTANDGLTCTACLMIGVSAMSLDRAHLNVAMLITGLAGLLMGATCMAIGEFISRNYDLDLEVVGLMGEREEEELGFLSNDPLIAAAATAVAFSVGAVVPLVVVVVMREYNLGLGVVEGATSTVLAMVGWLGPFFGRVPALRAALRVLLCGWVTMAITFGFMIVMISD